MYKESKWNRSIDINTVRVVAHLKNMLLICLRMKALSPRNLPYILCRQVLRKSLSRGSSLSNRSSSWQQEKSMDERAGGREGLVGEGEVDG